MKRLMSLPRGQRLLVFSFIVIGTLALLVAVTILLMLLTVNNEPRSVAQPIEEGVTVVQYAELNGNDAYPAALAVAPDGTAYTASYSTGEVFVMRGDETAQALPNTRETFGSVAGLLVTEQGLVVLDRVIGEAKSSGGVLWLVAPDGTISTLGRVSELEDSVAFNGLTRDADGYFYVADLLGSVWKFDPDGSNGAKWWEAPRENGQTAPVVSDVAYDATTNTLIVTDSEYDAVYRVDVGAASSERLYQFTGTQNAPGLLGVDVAPDGTLYLTAIDEKALMTLRDGELVYLAGFFRGPWDAAVLPDGRILVSNVDSRALATPGLSPQLPFGIDVVTVP